MGQTKSRKQIRKDQRKLKKVKRNDYFSKHTKQEPLPIDKKPKKNERQGRGFNKSKHLVDESKTNPLKKNITDRPDEQRLMAVEKRNLNKLQKQMGKQRNKQLLDANREEDRNIKRLEKQLKLNKRKTTSVPKSFSVDGLDYLLEVCDSETMEGAIKAEQHMMEGNRDFDEDFDLMSGKVTKKAKVVKTRLESDNESDSNDEFEQLNEESDMENELGEEEEEKELESEQNESADEDQYTKDMSNDTSDIDDSEVEEKSQSVDDETISKELREDIYGRLRDKEGNVVNETNSSKYIPPALRAKLNDESKEDAKQSEKLKRLKRQLKGSLNRLAEGNMHTISSQVENLYMSYSRNDMNDALTSLLIETLVSVVMSPDRLLMEHVMLVTILHANVGTEVGAHFLQRTIKLFDDHTTKPQNVDNKSLQNVVAIIAQLYNFKLIDCRLIYQILNRLAANFTETNIECLLVILKQIGFSLRKDDPIALKTLIIDLQKHATNLKEDTAIDNARVKFMLDILLAIKNNNVSKIPNYDTTYSEHLKKLLKGFIRKGYYVSPLNISLDDLLKADQKGKWWIVGSAWTGNIDNVPAIKKPNQDPVNTYSDKLLELAKKQRMNTDRRRNIFCIIMSAEDYLDAFEKLLHLGLKNQQEREIIQVILHCCLREKSFNSYYAVLCSKFCEYDRKYQMMIKYTVWDKLKALSDCSGPQISNLAKLLTYLFLEKAVSISILKIMHFSELDKVTLRLTRQILLGILMCDDLEKCQDVFAKVSQSEKLKMFKESLRLFIHHFLLKNLTNSSMGESETQVLQERASIIDKILSMSNKKVSY